MGFAHTNDGDKILERAPGRRTRPTRQREHAARRDGVRLAAGRRQREPRAAGRRETNLSGTTTSAPETVAIKLTYLEEFGVRADARGDRRRHRAGTDVRPLSTCVPPNLDQSQGVTSSGMCNSDGTGCTGTSITCPVSCRPSSCRTRTRPRPIRPPGCPRCPPPRPPCPTAAATRPRHRSCLRSIRSPPLVRLRRAAHEAASGDEGARQRTLTPLAAFTGAGWTTT